ncbi:hypothetical protein CDD83_10255 [Cordyceps sp. RAO-2017]|nr:hypothetical protein CDD83_10255 [Cordyceps sp. RAO-2017]
MTPRDRLRSPTQSCARVGAKDSLPRPPHQYRKLALPGTLPVYRLPDVLRVPPPPPLGGPSFAGAVRSTCVGAGLEAVESGQYYRRWQERVVDSDPKRLHPGAGRRHDARRRARRHGQDQCDGPGTRAGLLRHITPPRLSDGAEEPIFPRLLERGLPPAPGHPSTAPYEIVRVSTATEYEVVELTVDRKGPHVLE